MTRAELANKLGVSRSSLYRWMARDDCPNPDGDMKAFLAWAEVQLAENRGTDGRDEGPDLAELKASKLRADTVHMWQKVDTYRDALVAEAENADWADMQDILAEYRGELQRVAIEPRLHDQLNQALAVAVERVKVRADNALAARDRALADLRQLVERITPPTKQRGTS